MIAKNILFATMGVGAVAIGIYVVQLCTGRLVAQWRDHIAARKEK